MALGRRSSAHKGRITALTMLGVLALVILWPDVALILPKWLEPEFMK